MKRKQEKRYTLSNPCREEKSKGFPGIPGGGTALRGTSGCSVDDAPAFVPFPSTGACLSSNGQKRKQFKA